MKRYKRLFTSEPTDKVKIHNGMEIIGRHVMVQSDQVTKLKKILNSDYKNILGN